MSAQNLITVAMIPAPEAVFPLSFGGVPYMPEDIDGVPAWHLPAKHAHQLLLVDRKFKLLNPEKVMVAEVTHRGTQLREFYAMKKIGEDWISTEPRKEKPAAPKEEAPKNKQRKRSLRETPMPEPEPNQDTTDAKPPETPAGE